jgi:hypothetical protein
VFLIAVVVLECRAHSPRLQAASIARHIDRGAPSGGEAGATAAAAQRSTAFISSYNCKISERVEKKNKRMTGK